MTSPARTASVNRKTNETSIKVSLTLDGTGQADSKTGLGFLDHMLAQLAKHSLIDLAVHAEGDLHIDGHHTTEDVGITIGQAFTQALGERRGIVRFGHAYAPLDEALARVVVDISGRPQLVWKVAFLRDKVGDMDTELFREWFGGFAQAAGITLHVEALYGENNHHIIESCYKALAKALRMAAAIDPRLGDSIPSTKGRL